MLHTTNSTILISLLDTRGPTPSNLSLLMRKKPLSYHHSHPSGWLIWKVSKWHERERTRWALVWVSYPPMPSAFRFYQKARALGSHRHPYSVIDRTSSLCPCWVAGLKHCPPSTLCSWGFMKAYVVHWKTSHALKVELYFVQQKFLGLQALETASQVTLKELLQGGGGRSQVIQKFYNKGQIALNIKCVHV